MVSESDKLHLLQLARAVLIAFEPDPAEKLVSAFTHNPGQLTEAVLEPLPCFVTLRTKSGRLRGCIGSLQTMAPLYKNVAQYAQLAAFDDPRFRPVEKHELAGLKISITVLGPVKPLPSFESLEVGRHGLVVQSGARRGVLLASVAVEQGYDAKAFLQSTCEKAGLDPGNYKDYDWEYFEEVSFSE